MEWNSERREGALVVAPRGEIDHGSSDDFRAPLLDAVEQAAASGDRLVIDFSGVTYMSSVGLRVMMIAGRTAKEKDVPVALAGLNDTMAEIFRISRFDKVFPVHDSVESALAG